MSTALDTAPAPGLDDEEPTSGSDVDFIHTGPDTLAGRYMRQFWQPVAAANDLERGRALPLRVMSQDFTLYRGESGAPYLVDFRCAHRGTQLSTGWVEGDAIRCFYHGWKYDASGQCIEQPAEPKPFCHKVRIGSYPTREYLGLIFACLGTGQPPEFPRYPTWENVEGFLEWDNYVRPCNFFQNAENSGDTSHLGFVHRGTPGAFDGLTDSPQVEAEETSWGIQFHTNRPSGKEITTQLGMPNVFHHRALPNVPEVIGFREFLTWWVPIDDESHHQFTVVAQRLDPHKARTYIERRDARLAERKAPRAELLKAILAGHLRLEDVDPLATDIIRLQDDVAQVGQGVIQDRMHERLGRSDRGVIMVRKIWARELKLLAAGRPLKQWRYESERLQIQKDL